MDEPYLNRFLSRIDRTGNCWLWTRGKSTTGYGQFYKPEKIYAHRASYEHFIEPVPVGMEVAHICNVKACVRPEHLKLMTHAENMIHLKECGYAKGNPGNTWSQGEKSHHARLTDDQVRTILIDPRMQKDIAVDYGVARTTIAGIQQRRKWAHIPAPEGYTIRKQGHPPAR